LSYDRHALRLVEFALAVSTEEPGTVQVPWVPTVQTPNASPFAGFIQLRLLFSGSRDG